MCGRYTLVYEDFGFLLNYYGITYDTKLDYPARYNVAPGQDVPAVIHDGQKRRIGLLRWGLIPSWTKDQQIGLKMINARAETLPTKETFKRLLARKRCLIPADGFYEWKTLPNGRKQPMRIVLPSRPLFSFAGLYDTWYSPAGKKLSTCTIVTVEPNSLMQTIHSRMPAILHREDEEKWIHPGGDGGDLTELLRSYPEGDMKAFPVAPLVGNVSNDVPECILPVNP